MRRVVLSVLALLATTGAAAQQITGAIQGRIVGAGRQPLASVQVVVSSPNLQGDRRTLSDARGGFRPLALPPGLLTRVLLERSLIQRILRVYVVGADVRVGATFAQADRETETDPVAHVLHVTRGAGFHPTPFVTEAACLEPELDAALALQRCPRLGNVRRWPGRKRLAGRVADHGGADAVDLAHGRGPVSGPQRELGLDQPHLAAGREV